MIKQDFEGRIGALPLPAQYLIRQYNGLCLSSRTIALQNGCRRGPNGLDRICPWQNGIMSLSLDTGIEPAAPLLSHLQSCLLTSGKCYDWSSITLSPFSPPPLAGEPEDEGPYILQQTRISLSGHNPDRLLSWTRCQQPVTAAAPSAWTTTSLCRQSPPSWLTDEAFFPPVGPPVLQPTLLFLKIMNLLVVFWLKNTVTALYMNSNHPRLQHVTDGTNTEQPVQYKILKHQVRTPVQLSTLLFLKIDVGIFLDTTVNHSCSLNLRNTF